MPLAALCASTGQDGQGGQVGHHHQHRQGDGLGQAEQHVAQAGGLARRGGGRPARLGFQVPGQAAHGGVQVQRAHGGAGMAQAQAGHGGGGRQGMAAQIQEEVGVAGADGPAQRMGEGGGHHFLHLALRRITDVLRHVAGGGLRQFAPVDLATHGAGHRRHRHQEAGPHVGGDGGGDVGGDGVAVGRAHIPDDDAVDAGHGPHGGGGQLHAGAAGDDGLDLTQLDAEAAQLHLVVDPAQEIDAAVDQRPAHVAGGVQPVAGGIQLETLGGFLRPVQVAVGQGRAADVDLPGLAHRHRLPVGRQHQHAISGQGPADGHRLARARLVRRRHHRGLGGAIGVQHAPAGGPLGHQAGGAGLPPHHQQADVGQFVVDQAQQGGHGGKEGGAAAAQFGRQQLWVAHHQAGGRQQAGTGGHGQPHLLHRGVECQGKTLPDPVCLHQLVDFRRAADIGHDRAVRQHHALGQAGGARGEDEIAGVAGQRRQHGVRQAVGRHHGVVQQGGADQILRRHGGDARHLQVAHHVDHQVGFGLFGDAGDAGGGPAGVDGDIGGAAQQDAEQAGV
ncbi:MAG: hypothetical protein PW843_18560 [Azospirillaceae bacterium]|nr:hypothetical protein [Azospirillaceae bacterium]